MTPHDLLTKKDLEDFKKELFQLLENGASKPAQSWLKTKDVLALLGISPGTLQQLRDSGQLPFSKLGGVFYFKAEDIEKALEKGQKKKS